MKHLIICREYPPAPGGGIGTYAQHISQLLVQSGETVHVISQLWDGATRGTEEQQGGKLIIHRLPFDDRTAVLRSKPHPLVRSKEARALFRSDFSPQSFSWQAAVLAERLVKDEGIDLVEAQDYEAPLYYFQLRRALGFGPKRTPPCFVHLHSPTEFIVRHNEWDISLGRFATAKRLEDYTIAAADALLCPSRFFADQAEAHYGITEGSIEIIPYPVGEMVSVDRDRHIWWEGTIAYVGRLERRKGTLEWIKAAVAIAQECPAARFDFIGRNILGPNPIKSEEILDLLIPSELRGRFSFRGRVNRSEIAQLLRMARMAVIPSLWENFPNTCIEAMNSGLPVIATREGGMVEMVEDGVTGWLVQTPDQEGLHQALRRALETSARKIAEMGAAAAKRIRQICDNRKVVERHLSFRTRLVDEGAKRSLALPLNVLAPHAPTSAIVRRLPKSACHQGLAVVVAPAKYGKLVEECFESILRQTHKPVTVVLVIDGSAEWEENILRAQREGWQIVRESDTNPMSARSAGIKAIMNSGLNPIGVAFLGGEEQLRPEFGNVCESVFHRCPDVAIISCWADYLKPIDKLWIRPCPSFPYQWVANDTVRCAAFRTEALLEIGDFFRRNAADGHWDLCTFVLAKGWAGVTIPDVLVQYASRSGGAQSFKIPEGFHKKYGDLLAKDTRHFPRLLAAFNGAVSKKKYRVLGEHLSMAWWLVSKPRGVFRVFQQWAPEIVHRIYLRLSNSQSAEAVEP